VDYNEEYEASEKYFFSMEILNKRKCRNQLLYCACVNWWANTIQRYSIKDTVDNIDGYKIVVWEMVK